MFVLSTCTFRPFLMMLYKGFLLRRRHYVQTFLEAIFPVLVLALPLLHQPENQQGDNSTRSVAAISYSSFNPLLLQNDYFGTFYSSLKTIHFLYTPANNWTAILMKKATNTWMKNNIPTSRNLKWEIEPFETDAELEKRALIIQVVHPLHIVIGTRFNNLKGPNLPESLNYAIRYIGTMHFGAGYKYRLDGPQKTNAYNETMFLSWQATVEKTFIEERMMEKNLSFLYELNMNRFPYPAHKEKLNEDFQTKIVISWLIGGAVFPYLVIIIYRVLEEKRNRSKELMKIMGMSDAVYWISTFVNFYIPGVVSMIIIACLYTNPIGQSPSFFEHCNTLILCIVLLLFLAQIILFSFIFSVLFKHAVHAIICFTVIYLPLHSYLGLMFFMPTSLESYFKMNLASKICIILYPSGALTSIFSLIATQETRGTGVQWSNLAENCIGYDISFLLALGCLIASVFLHVAAIWLLNKILSMQQGITSKLCFLFTKNDHSKSESSNFTNSRRHNYLFEAVPHDIIPSVVMRNLYKVYKTCYEEKVAINNLSLCTYAGQITVLLGSNGSGKSTTLNMLTGHCIPNSGTVKVNGVDVLKNKTLCGRNIGVCLQENILCDTLTVEENLRFYAGLKGIQWTELSRAATDVMRKLNLAFKRNVLAQNLSGGMKRKLCFGIAIIGKPDILILDEPTSGMDVKSRRRVWNILLSLRDNHTIILTTHYMDEADRLGDRIAIMANGQIVCCGSPFFLKQNFGYGYHLHILKDQHFLGEKTFRMIQGCLPEAFVEKCAVKEVSFNLGFESTKLPDMLDKLEASKLDLGIISCDVTEATLEDVFLNVFETLQLFPKDKQHFVTVSKKLQEKQQGGCNDTEYKGLFINNAASNFKRKFLSLMIKKFHCMKHSHLTLMIQTLTSFSIICICLGITAAIARQSITYYDPLELNISSVYGDTEGFYMSNESPEALSRDVVEVMTDHNVLHSKVDDCESSVLFILQESENIMQLYFQKLHVGYSIMKLNNSTNLTVWFNGEPYHSMPMSLLLANTAILRHVLGSGSITLTCDPLPASYDLISAVTQQMKIRMIAGFFFPLAFAFLMAGNIKLPIHERVSKAKLLQLMTGIQALEYWLSVVVWDMLASILVCVLLLLPFAIFNPYVFFYAHLKNIGIAFVIMVVHCWACLPFNYLLSLRIKNPNSGYAVVVVLGLTTGSLLGVVLGFLEDVHPEFQLIIWLLRLFPSFTLSSGMSKLFVVAYNNAFCDTISPADLERYCVPEAEYSFSPYLQCCQNVCDHYCNEQKDLFSWSQESCGPDIFVSAAQGIIFFFFLVCIESFSFSNLLIHLRNMFNWHWTHQNLKRSFTGDANVILEEKSILSALENNMDFKENGLLVLNLTKSFHKVKAVKHLTFRVRKKECFGILGVNGAGKTSLFKMLTGDTRPTSGNAFAFNSSMVNNAKEFQRLIGYCPQSNALIDELTGREMITLIARLRNVPDSILNSTVKSMLTSAGLAELADSYTKLYSGGNKRKLLVAMALIGSPPLVLLDEPTAGVNPLSRREIWRLLSQFQEETGASIILTSHSMEECEALCDRIAIMTKGRFQCLGSKPELKFKYGRIYTATIKLRKDMCDDLNAAKTILEYIQKTVPDATMEECHKGTIVYQIKSENMTIAKLFRLLNDAKDVYGMEDFFINEASLEEIFLNFANRQRIVV